MKSRFSRVLLIAGIAAGFGVDSPWLPLHAAETKRPAAIGQKVSNVDSLRDLKGNLRPLHDFRGNRAVVLAFVATECPLANLYTPRLIELAERYRARGVLFLAVYPNAHDTLDLVAAHAYDRDIPFPVLKDFHQGLADTLGVERTPHVVVLDGEFVVRYHGRIDDQYAVSSRRHKPTRRDLAEALQEVLASSEVSVPETKADGCLLDRAAETPKIAGVTYAKEVAPILQKRCQACHRPGQIGPFSLVTHADAVERSSMLKEVITQRRMPPWHADARYGKFSNDRHMSQQEIDTVVSWIDAGMPQGDAGELPKPTEWHEGWNIGKPDMVFSMSEEFEVPADGVIPYKFFPIKTNFEEDRWVKAAELKAGEPSVVHHLVVYMRVPGQKGLVAADGTASVLTAWAPGVPPLVCPPDTALRIPKGTQLTFQLHYTPIGKPVKDRSSIGIVFAKQPPKREIELNFFAKRSIRIPPHTPHHREENSFTFPEDARLLSLLPHMHYRGKDFRYEAIYPDGRHEIILSVPRWDFNWQTVYKFAEPLHMPKGTKIHVTAHWDNSRNNPHNPDPSAELRYGPQSWHEMMLGLMTYVRERPIAESVAHK